MPDFDDNYALSSWIEINICAEFPTLLSTSSNEDILYHDLVEKYMIHTCSSGTPNSCLNDESEYAKRFTCEIMESRTTFN